MRLAINASRARSGGGKSHLVGVLSSINPYSHGFNEIHVWSYRELLSLLPKKSWLIKHTIKVSNQSIIKQIFWEYFFLPDEIKKSKCNILINVDAGTVCKFKPSVTMSRDMLSYEKEEMYRYGFSRSLLRLLIIKYVQNKSLLNASGTIFLTNYAKKIIQKSTGNLKKSVIIPHGVSDKFRVKNPLNNWPKDNKGPIRCLYVSNIAPYKHQWHVVRAVKILRDNGFNLELNLIGGVNNLDKPSKIRLNNEIDLSDPDHFFVKNIGFIEQKKLPSILKKSDLFIFASSCENMPNSLIEAMASGLPIACSNRGPMPEVLKKGGLYFDPEKPLSIANTLKKLIQNDIIRKKLAKSATIISRNYSWKRCGNETLNFLKKIAKIRYS